MEAGHSWKYCNARIPPASEQTSGGGSQGQNNGGETVCCRAKCMPSTNDDSCIQESSEGVGEKWIAGSGASFRMTHLADFLRDIRLSDDRVRIAENYLIDVVRYGTLAVLFPGGLTVKLLDVAYVPDIAFNLLSLMAAHTQRDRFKTGKEGLCISLFDGR